MKEWFNENVWKPCKKWIKKGTDFFEKYVWRKVLGFLFFVPLILQLNPVGFSTWLKSWVRIGTPRDWLSFWSSYLGSILTVTFSYSIAKYETKKQQEILQKQFEHDEEISQKQIEQKNEDKLIENLIRYRETRSKCFQNANNAYMLFLKDFKSQKKIRWNEIDKLLNSKEKFDNDIAKYLLNIFAIDELMAYKIIKQDKKLLAMFEDVEKSRYKLSSNKKNKKNYNDFSNDFKKYLHGYSDVVSCLEDILIDIGNRRMDSKLSKK